MKLIRTGLHADSFQADETLFHVANGYLGVRGNLEEGRPEGFPTIRGCYINGFYDTVGIHYHEKLFGFPEDAQRLVNLPDVQTMRIFLNGEEFSPLFGDLLECERTLDTDDGVVKRRMRWRGAGGETAALEITRMASFTRPELFLTVYSLLSEDFEGEVEIVSEVNCDVYNFVDKSDPRVASDSKKHLFFDRAEIIGGTDHVGGAALARCHTGVSGLELAVCQKHLAASSGAALGSGTAAIPGAAAGPGAVASVQSRITESGFETRIAAHLSAGGRITVEKYTIMSDSRRQADPAWHALEMAEGCAAAGSVVLLEEQKAYLDKFWGTSRAEISGCPEICDDMEFNIYQLLQSAGRDAVGNVASKGISGEGYEGHYFWDTEIYIFPFFLFTQPEIAQNLLDFRCNTLGAAKEHARDMGHKKGALYPWRTISGGECSSYFPAGSAQYHITGDVAYSFIQYYYATGDLGYMAEKGAAVLLETARLWIDTGNYGRDGKFHIHDVTGPDEYTCIVSDNYYTNRCAQYNLRGAVEIYGLLKKAGLDGDVNRQTGFDERELDGFTRAAAAMALPYDEKLGIHMQDASFLDKPIWDIASTPKEDFPLLLHYHPLYLYRHQICKQADTILSHFLFEDGVPEEVMRRSYEYYEKITAHDSSLSSCVFSVMASRLGFTNEAYEFFLDAVRTDLDNTHGNTKDGLHIANLGGAWLSLVCGFAGLRLKADGLHFRFTLPEQWDGYTFRIRYHGSLLRAMVKRGCAELYLEGGKAITVFVNGAPCRVGE